MQDAEAAIRIAAAEVEEKGIWGASVAQASPQGETQVLRLDEDAGLTADQGPGQGALAG